MTRTVPTTKQIEAADNSAWLAFRNGLLRKVIDRCEASEFKGAKRELQACDILCGMAYALDHVNNDYKQNVLNLAFVLSMRGVYSEAVKLLKE